ncbi:TM2 domain-containing membrane protein YozV [Gracilibacillus kekensis]|uniref:TM2 domain-containing membrane protein YozV n=1 Tax=Gracilibacillus kekensis TaxID=1027249 RepID=A0A1M7JNA1_9BACI|nr:TM2 domain-containing membrane protein YozV [Gracilibacillus kekensis]
MNKKEVSQLRERNIAIAYILWFFFGQIGVHRFYTGRIGSGIAQLLLGVVGWFSVWIVIGWIPLIVLWVWLFVDIFLIPSMCRNPR